MNLDRLLRRWFFYAAAVLVLLLCGNVLLYYFGVSRISTSAVSVARAVKQNQVSIQKLEVQEKGLQALVVRYRKGEQSVKALCDDYLKTREIRFVGVQKNLQALIQKNGMETETFRYGYKVFPRDNNADKGWKHRYLRVDLQVPLSGSYPQIKKFLADVQKSHQFLILRDLGISSSSAGGSVLKLRVDISTYFVATPDDLEPSPGGRT
ncbi:MAG: hypothetical protein P8018_02655 [Acidobacteriota bacterium]|jgi:Tfp pilus assembly protein PilO